jgi:hypothetical protein
MKRDRSTSSDNKNHHFIQSSQIYLVPVNDSNRNPKSDFAAKEANLMEQYVLYFEYDTVEKWVSFRIQSEQHKNNTNQSTTTEYWFAG